MKRDIQITSRIIGKYSLPFLIAEMSGNHNQSLDRALTIVAAAAKAGAHAIKIQTYTADTMTLDLSEGEFFIADKPNPWSGNSLYQLYQQAYTPWEWHKPIFDKAKELNLIAFSTPFDETAVDFLERLNVPAYKISSFENTDLPLIRKVAATGKPLFVSTGMATVAELYETVRTARECGCQDLFLLKCTSTYPADPKNSNLLTIPHLRELFDCEVGLSDHTLGIGAAIASVALGASVIEKHFTLRRADGGVDSIFSLEPEEFFQLRLETERAWHALGGIKYGPIDIEKQSTIFRRSLYIVEDVEAGEELTPQNLRRIRPGYGIAPKYYEMALGRRAKQFIKKGTPLKWDLLH